MLLYNSLTRNRDEFVPNEAGKVKMYTCGPTVYHFAHIGNLRTYIMEDTLEKYLRYLGYDVTRAMNITDVGHLTDDADDGEDKMLKGARREHKTVMEIAQYYTDAFFADCDKLNIKITYVPTKAAKMVFRYIVTRPADNAVIIEAETTQLFVSRSGTFETSNPDFVVEWKKHWNIPLPKSSTK